jgi:hypothetical protein
MTKKGGPWGEFSRITLHRYICVRGVEGVSFALMKISHATYHHAFPLALHSLNPTGDADCEPHSLLMQLFNSIKDCYNLGLVHPTLWSDSKLHQNGSVQLIGLIFSMDPSPSRHLNSRFLRDSCLRSLGAQEASPCKNRRPALV